jgi:alpha-galactosidase
MRRFLTLLALLWLSIILPLRGFCQITGNASVSGNVAIGPVHPYYYRPTPQMGWNQWPAFDYYGNGSEAVIKAIADAIVYYGLNADGYQYVSIDEGWEQSTRDANGNLQVNTTKYPDGMAAVAAYVHNDGLLFGAYLSGGTTDCTGNPGSFGHEYQDATLIASWGSDLLKYDVSCNVPIPQVVVATMARALQATSRPILYATGTGTFQSAFQFYAQGAQDARIGNDMAPITAGWGKVVHAFTNELGLAGYGGPNHWLDEDTLMVGPSLTTAEDQANFSLWAIQAAPLTIGADIRVASSPSAATLATLGNTYVIAVDQDALGVVGTQWSSVNCGSATCQVWVKQLTGSAWAIAFFNLDSGSHTISITWSALHAVNSAFPTSGFTTTMDLWAQSSLGTLSSGYAPTVSGYGVSMIRVAP